MSVRPDINMVVAMLQARNQHALAHQLALAGIDYEKLYKLIVKEIIDTQTTWEDVLHEFEKAEKELVKRDKDHAWVRTGSKWYVRSLPSYKKATSGLEKIKFRELLRTIITEIIDTNVAWEDIVHRLDMIGERLVKTNADHQWLKTPRGHFCVSINKEYQDFSPEKLSQMLRWQVGSKIERDNKTFYFSQTALNTMPIKSDDAVDGLITAIRKIPSKKWQNLVTKWAVISISELKRTYKSAVGVYFPAYKMIVLPQSEVVDIYRDKANAVRTVMHEIGHAMDYKLGIGEQVTINKLAGSASRAAKVFQQTHGDNLSEGIAETLSWLVVTPAYFEMDRRAKLIDKQFLGLLADIIDLELEKRRDAGIPDKTDKSEAPAPKKDVLTDTIDNSWFATPITLELDRPIPQDEKDAILDRLKLACSKLPQNVLQGAHLKITKKAKQAQGFDRDVDILADQITLHGVSKASDIQPELIAHAVGHLLWDSLTDKQAKAFFAKNAAVFGLTPEIATIKDKQEIAAETFAELCVWHYMQGRSLPVSLSMPFYKLLD